MQDEILKHTKKAISAMNNQEHSIGHKIKEIAIEIGIIVFAVSLSIWLHGWSEHRHQQAEVKEFLFDLREDLKQDVERLKNAKKKAEANLKDYEFIYSLTEKKVDSLKKKHGSVQANFTSELTHIQFNTANYEGFKSSGKIGQIENKNLKRQVLAYYQDTTTGVNKIEDMRSKNFNEVLNFIIASLEKGNNEFFFKSTFKYKVKLHIDFSKGLINFYDTAVKEANKMLKAVDEFDR
jgi:hypothetical protein